MTTTTAITGEITLSGARRITDGDPLDWLLDRIDGIDPIDAETEDAPDADWAVHRALNHLRADIARRKAVQAGPDAVGDYCGHDGEHGRACGADLGLPDCRYHAGRREYTPDDLRADMLAVFTAPRPRPLPPAPCKQTVQVVLSTLASGPATRDRLAARNGVPYGPGSRYGEALDAAVRDGLVAADEAGVYSLTPAGIADLAAARPDRAVHAVTCPRCKARPGGWCRTSGGNPCGTHAARYGAAGIARPGRR